jgi:hypothetical protein
VFATLAPALQPTGWPGAMTDSHDLYEVRPRKDKRGVDLISDALPFFFPELRSPFSVE